MAKPTLLLEAHLKALRLPTFLREYDKVARHCAQEDLDCPRYLFRLCELELLDREQRATERRIKAAKFPVLKSLETFEFCAIPSLMRDPVVEQAPGAGAARRENVWRCNSGGQDADGSAALVNELACCACKQDLGYRRRDDLDVLACQERGRQPAMAGQLRTTARQRARRIWRWRWGWPPVRKAIGSASPPPPRW